MKSNHIDSNQGQRLILNLIENNAKNIDLYIDSLKESKTQLVSQAENLIKSINGTAENLNELIQKYEEHYISLKNKFSKLLGRMGKDASINTVALEDNEFYSLISQSVNCVQYFEFVNSIQKEIKNLEQISENVQLKDFIVKSHEFYRRNKKYLDNSLEKFTNKKRRASNLISEFKDLDEETAVDGSEGKAHQSPNKTALSSATAAEKEDLINNALEGEITTSMALANTKTEQKGEVNTKELDLKYGNFRVHPYSLKVNRNFNENVNGEEIVSLESNENTQTITEELNNCIILLVDMLSKEKGVVNEYVISNIAKCLNVRRLYFAEFDMTSKNHKFNYEFICKDNNLIDPENFKYVKVILIRRGKSKINNLVRSVENFFSLFVKRKDPEGNASVMGVLAVPFEKLKSYYSQTMKSFEYIDAVQIEVYLYIWDLVNDFSNDYDKTNIPKSEITELLAGYKILETSRKLAAKKKLLK